MTKTTKAHFKLFRDECLYWQKRLGLVNYDIGFKLDALDDSKSEIHRDIVNKVAVVKLDSNWEDDFAPLTNDEIIMTALHEILHLLLTELALLGRSRFCTDYDLEQAEESVVRTLTKELIKLRKVGK